MRSLMRGWIDQPPYVRLLSGLVLLFVLCGGCEFGDTTKVTPTITWASPAAITYGTPLSSTQLNATASVDGTFVYTPPGSTVLNAGAQTLSVAFTPTDSSKYDTASASVSLTVNKATPTLTWAAPAAIDAATPLSATQLNATASVAGSFVYTPAAGTLLNAGAQTLSVTFTPTDTTNYTSASATVSITVNAVSGGIGPAGGIVSGFYGASVTIPAGALSTSVDIGIPRDSTAAPTLPSTGIDTAGAMYALTPHGTAFSLPATVQIPFDSTRIPTDATPVLYKAEQGGAFSPFPTTVNGNMLSADVSNFSWVIPGYASTLPRMVYALTRDGNGVISVSSFKMDKTSPSLSAATSSAPVGNGAISVTVHPSRRFLYVTNGSASTPGAATGVPANSISVYQLDSATGNISGPTDTQPINANPISVVVHPTGKFIYVVNEVRFGGTIGNISVFSIDNATGALTSQGTAADLGGVPATALAFAPSGKFAYVTYMPPDPQNNNNFDTVKTYGVSTTSGLFTSSPIGSAPTGDNPWALAVTRGGHFAYVASLSTQGSVNELSVYSINQTSGTLSLQSSLPMLGAKPASLAMDSESRFLYVGRQQPFSNRNLEVYSINPTNGGLSLMGGVLLGSGPETGPIAVTAEPQGQFVYAEDFNNGTLVPFAVNGTTGALTPGNPVSGIFLGGASGGVGDPFFFAASGTSPVWQNNCTVIVDDAFVFDGCPTALLSTGPGGSSGGGGNPPPPAATFVLTVIFDTTGGSVISSPSGIDKNPLTGQDFFEHAFPNGSSVTLTAEPPDFAQAYDVHWTGACSGNTPTATVFMTQDQTCYVSFTPVSLR
ncbi:MAG: beta-propeller fold lactonase family protein [Candidatus Acidiferrum sp.]